MSGPWASVSIVCVYNRLAVREHCLDRSIQALAGEALDVEYLPIANVNGKYPSAGAALNHGVTLASNDVVVFAHQDAYLHSLTALKAAAGRMRVDGFGLLGAVGVRSDGLLTGRIRDRIMLTGAPVSCPSDVDSVDEVLFMAPREQLLRHPLSEAKNLAWHAYAVEYGLRMRVMGLRTGVASIPLTHNSLSANLARLDEAHQEVARLYPDLLPVKTTCGPITGRPARAAQPDRSRGLGSQRWRYRWLRDSMALQAARKAAGGIDGVLADLRFDIDDLVARAPGRRLGIVNCDGGRPFAADNRKPLELRRKDGVVVFSARPAAEIPAALIDLSAAPWTLVTNLSEPDLMMLEPHLRRSRRVLGFHHATGLWLLVGATVRELPEDWWSTRSTPLRANALAAAALLR